MKVSLKPQKYFPLYGVNAVCKIKSTWSWRESLRFETDDRILRNKKNWIMFIIIYFIL
jgi:hypothetical protein